MRLLVLSILACLLCAGCANEGWVLGPNGKGHLHGNFKNVTVRQTPTSFYMHADEIDNATATTAGGDAFAKGVGSIGDLGLKIGMARAMAPAVGAIKAAVK